MLIEITTNITGYRNGEEWPRPGEVVDFPDHEANDLIVAGYAKQCCEVDLTPIEGAEPLPPADDTLKTAEGTGVPLGEGIEVPSDGTVVELNEEGSSDVGDQEAAADDAGDTATVEGSETTSETGGAEGDEDDAVILDELDKPGLLAYAAAHGLEVNERLGEVNLRAAIREAQA